MAERYHGKVETIVRFLSRSTITKGFHICHKFVSHIVNWSNDILISIEDERNISRSLFYKAYEEMGLSKPQVISI